MPFSALSVGYAPGAITCRNAPVRSPDTVLLCQSIDYYTATSEDVLLSIFFADLSLLDVFMSRFTPFTVASASTLLSRVTLDYFSKQSMLLTPYGAVHPSNRECINLIEEKRPYVPVNDSYLLHPLGLPWVLKFITSSASESRACALCVVRLWRLCWYVTGVLLPYTSSYIRLSTGISLDMFITRACR
jgi:hypothetical protein